MKRSSFTWLYVLVILSLFLEVYNRPVEIVQAQTGINPQSWQTSSVGLKATPATDGKTAGLGFIVDATNWPSLSMQGGVQPFWDVVLGPVGVPLGKIKTVQSSSATLSAQSSSWAKNKLTFTPPAGGGVNLWVSRLSPAVLAETTDSALRLFAGNVTKYTFSNEQIVEQSVPVRPKYLAYATGGVKKYNTLSTSATNLTALDQGWMLLWLGNNTHIMETKRILDYGAPPLTDAYMADIPILLVFQNQPTSIKLSSEGGVELTFSGAAGRVAILPLYGRDHPAASQTEGWYTNLPTGVNQKIQFWAPRLAYFPADVTETYNYTGGDAVISETVNYETVRAGGTKYAPVPPILALAKPVLNPIFSHPVVESGYASQFGPILGFDNRDSYSWTVENVDHYIDPRRKIPQEGGTVPADLQTELVDQVNRLVSAGHMDPWMYADQVPNVDYRGDIYWANPGDTLYQLAEVAEALPDGATKTSLINYMTAERNNYPPEDVYNLDFGLGASRGPAGLPTVGDVMSDELQQWNRQHDDVFLTRVPLYSFYGLSRYYQVVEGTPSTATYQKALQALDRDMREQDWASLGWFEGYQDRREAAVNTNRLFAGLVGFTRLAKQIGDTAANNISRALVARAMVARLGQLRYTRYLYEAGLIQLPTSPKWQVESMVNVWNGMLFNYSWINAYDDARQVFRLNQFAFDAYDHSGVENLPGEFDRGHASAHLFGYRDMVPELGRVLTDYALQDARITLVKFQALTPHWYATYGEATLGGEHGMNHPTDSFQLFMAERYFDDPPADELARYADFSWLERGDLFYMQKLAETIFAYRGAVWQNEISLSVTSRDSEMYLAWEFHGVVPELFTWRVDYRIKDSGEFQSITNLPQSTRSYHLQNLQNYQVYEIQVAMVTGETDEVTSKVTLGMPSDLLIFLPGINR